MSSKRIIGSAEILGNLTLNGKYAMRTFNGVGPNANTGIISYPYYKRQEVQDILDMLPISRIGEMDYLPLNISGSFRGATSYSFTLKVQPTILEDDGTFVCLRSGTNGSSYDFYYSYIRNIRNIDVIKSEDVVQTNTAYRPSFFNSTQRIMEFYGSNGYELLWYKTIDNSSITNIIVTLTNGSFNEVGHQSVSISTASFHNFTPGYAHVVNDIVYMWGWDATLGQGRGIQLYTIPVNSIRAGNTTGFTRVTGFNGQNIFGQVYSNVDTANVYTTYASINAADNPMFLYSGDMYGPEYHNWTFTNVLAFPNATNTQIRFSMFVTYRYNSRLTVSDDRMFVLSMVYNISTKTFTFDTTTRGPITVSGTPDASGQVMIYNENNPYIVDSINWRGFRPRLGNCGTICQAGDGFSVASCGRWVSESAYWLTKFQINNFTTQFESINMNTRTVNNPNQIPAIPTYGSAVGENINGVRFISKTRVIAACSGTYDNQTIADYDNTVVSDVGTDINFTYQSLTHGTLQGYAPQTYRKFAPNTNLRLSGMITLVDEVGNVTAHGSSFFEGLPNKEGGLNINPDTLNYDGGSVILSSSVMQTLKQAVSNASGVSLDNSRLAVYYVPDSSYCHSMAVLMSRYSDNTGRIVYAEVDLTTSVNAGVTTITGGTVFSTRQTTNNLISEVIDNNMARFNGLVCAKYNGFNYLSVNSGSYFRIPADNRSYSMIAKFKNNTISASPSPLYVESYYLSNYGRYGCVIPGVGFGLCNNNIANDYQTKATLQLYGTTEAQLDGMLTESISALRNVVMLAQDVPEGFTVYFTQELPVFIGGYYYKLPIQNIDLRTIKSDPSNSTFYVYISMNRSTAIATYIISTTLIEESLTQTYIGTIVTGATGITTINTEKVTRFLTYRPSTVKRGSAIPSSTGVPSGTGTRWH